MNDDKLIVLFDGVCNLCYSLVIFIIRRDKKAKFKFASIQSDKGQSLLKRHNLATDDIDTFVLIKNNNIYLKSSAGLHVIKELDGMWRLLYGFIIIPRPIRDFVYDKIANSRYNVFGKRDTCMVPSDELKERFWG